MFNTTDILKYLNFVPLLFCVTIGFIIYRSIYHNNNQKLLEFPSYYYFGKENIHISKNPLKTKLTNFCNTFNDQCTFIVSLSGGVDSMVLLALLLNIIPANRIITASINYNQRDESHDEMEFLHKYVSLYRIKKYSTTINIGRRRTGDIKRKFYEETSQQIRYDLYNKIINENRLDPQNTIILLGHHKNDLIENIFNNFMSGRKLTDLEVMKELSSKHGLIYGRPLLDFQKSAIYNLAYKHNIPFFKDTTPKWSKRGLMRNKLFPLLFEIYPNFMNSLKNQGENSNELNKMVQDTWINDFIFITEEIPEGIIYKWFNKTNNFTKVVWHEILSTILHENGVPMISTNSFNIFLDDKIQEKYNILSKHVSYRRTVETTIIKIYKNNLD
ncbi:putative 3'-5' exonuclease/tRNA(Ile) lysidine synthetase [Cafeteria roenbergensis virus]|uniref:tRNA(Ile)-lysidine synthetase n=1 Tax=Cafeteria roenbergensis virus (strain BV-PW1) TaxID=693272 RepID=E3T4I1_CROVB|nr:putative 3'-5' exonuclease/tRNA(Ile) lysidine synthetase [Cafeteria roenbergensis virus BV-PW1]ADO67094.1 putative 3'-5' exonuclease/tRNA(Ile) lysidine synthetase [Cafeteria roenbergensis virus BV-PW1]